MEGDPMDNAAVREAMDLMYGKIIETWGETPVDPTGVLLKCLASVVHHSDWLSGFGDKSPGHPFLSLPVLNNPQLLLQLKGLVTLEPTGQVKAATGIPPHTQSAMMCRDILETSRETLLEVKNISLSIKEAVGAAMEEKAEQNGHITGEKLKEVLGDQYKNLSQLVDNKISDLIDTLAGGGGATTGGGNGHGGGGGTFDFADGEEDEVESTTTDAAGQIRHRLYSFGGRLYQVPELFEFPADLKLDTGWKLWMGGQPGYHTKNKNGLTQLAPIRPYRLLDCKLLPPKLASAFRLKFLPIYTLMSGAPGLEFKTNTEALDASYINESYKMAKEHLKTRVSYIFANSKWQPDNWLIGTWSMRVQRSSITKDGTKEDIDKLGDKTKYNKKRKPKVRENADGIEKKRRRKTKKKKEAATAIQCLKLPRKNKVLS